MSLDDTALAFQTATTVCVHVMVMGVTQVQSEAKETSDN